MLWNIIIKVRRNEEVEVKMNIIGFVGPLVAGKSVS